MDTFSGLTDVLLDNPHIAGLCCTQLAGVEQGMKGLHTYDRRPKFPTEFLRSVLGRTAAIERG